MLMDDPCSVVEAQLEIICLQFTQMWLQILCCCIKYDFKDQYKNSCFHYCNNFCVCLCICLLWSKFWSNIVILSPSQELKHHVTCMIFKATLSNYINVSWYRCLYKFTLFCLIWSVRERTKHDKSLPGPSGNQWHHAMMDPAGQQILI